MSIDSQIIDKYHELAKYCPKHTLLPYITIHQSKIVVSNDFAIVFRDNEQQNLLDYLDCLNKALKVEYEINELIDQRKRKS